MGNVLINNAIVIPMYEVDGKRYFRGSIGIEGNRIAMVDRDGTGVGEFRERFVGDLREIDGRGFAVMPGLINSHCHTPMTLMRSYADDLPLMSWLKDHIWPFEARMTEEDIRLGAELGVTEMLLGGTTCFLDMYFNEPAIADVVERAGMRAVLSATLMGDNHDRFERELATLVAIRDEQRAGGRVTPMVACHSPYTVSREGLLYAKDLAKKYDLGMTIHVAETLDEINVIREQTGMTPVGYLENLELLDSSTIAVHCVHMTDEDIRIFAKRGVSVSHNPQSNMKLASGIARIVDMIADGINVIIGTDGASSNNDLDMWEEMRSASFLQKVAANDPCALPAWEVLKMATVSAAKALGLNDKIGALKEGMFADIIMIDMDKPHLHPQTDIIANLVYCAKGSDVDMVLIDGEVIVENGKLKGWDLQALYNRIDRRVKELRVAE